MDMTCDERPSDSPLVQRVWHSYSERAVAFTSIASPHWEMVISRYQGKTLFTVRGPETRPTPAYGFADAEFFGIQFKPGTLMPAIPPSRVMDRCDVNLPPAGSQSFWLNGSAWQYPTPENADTFVDRLVREGLLIQEPLVGAVLHGQVAPVSLRTVQRRFLQATGLTHGKLMQIERARRALTLLRQGVSILDTVDQAGYADQPHLTRALKHWIGLTPAQIIAENRQKVLSLLFKTTPF